MKTSVRYFYSVLFVIAACFAVQSFVSVPPDARRLEILFLGHNSDHHNSSQLADILAKEFFNEGFNFTYTTNPDDLNKEKLSHYDVLVLYANHDSIGNSQATALLDFVKQGKGFVPLHCASHCFRNNAEVVRLIGGQFSKHGQDSFPSFTVQPDHPVMREVKPFTTVDETYTHQNLSDDINVLMERVDGNHREPYTWTKTYGTGRVFYTAYGHDEKTFIQPSFLQLVKNGISWAAGEAAFQQLKAFTPAKLQYTEAKIPNYEKRNPPPKLQAALSPEQSMSLIQVPAGFTLELFAAEPDIINPIAMNWDEKGRLWVIETVDYPNTVRDNKQAGDDRIKILEDTDDDGRADKFTVFAGGLNIPTSLVFWRDGIIVSQAPYLLYLKDTDGDDRADKCDTLMTGWGTFDTHAGPSNLRYGFDNRIWGTVGYSGFRGKPGKDSVKFSQAIFSFAPHPEKVSDLQQLGGTSNNTWGLGFSEEFDVFASTANNTHSVFLGLPIDYLRKAGIKEPGTEKVDAHYQMHVMTKNLRQVDVFGGFTAAAGHSIYTARSYPREYWNRIAFVCEPTGRLVHQVQLKQDGAGFRETGDGWNLMASSDEWMGPVQADPGPDGQVWVADWYDFIIQHNPTPEGFVNGKGNAHENPLRDHERGRIYKIKYTAGKTSPNIKLDKKDVSGLLAALKNDNLFWRTHAQRLLVENGNLQVLPALYTMIGDTAVDELGMNPAAIHAIWTLQGLHQLDGKNTQAMRVVTKALAHPAAGVRRAAVQALPMSALTMQALAKAGIFRDADLRVRLAGLIAIAQGGSGSNLLRVIKTMQKDSLNTRDKWIQLALQAAEKIHSTQTAQTAAKQPKTASPRIDKKIVISVLKNVMKFDKELITAKAGSTIQVQLNNPDFMQHNLLILQRNSLEKVGKAADALAGDPDGAKMQYVPKMPEVLFGTPLVDPEGSYTFTFKVPAQKGDYPFICSFPGHWRIMQGVLRVE